MADESLYGNLPAYAPKSVKARIMAAQLMAESAAQQTAPYTSRAVVCLEAIEGLMGGLQERSAIKEAQQGQADQRRLMAQLLLSSIPPSAAKGGAAMHALPSAEVIRLPVRLRVVSSRQIAVKNLGFTKGVEPISKPKTGSGLALDALLSAGTLDARQHAAALAYAALRRRYDRSGGPMRSWRDRSGLSDEAWQAVKRDHARLIRAVGAERFILDRLCLNDNAPLASEVQRVRMALERVAANFGAATE